ncbi:FecCD family ABC transporter permease [Saccharospirillum mangrovi]|uniref:FecCD family ABC transporter permease n=1 Tax=Saccharospirillum mangrovi TaxID=2161747 RepID=UPI000D3A2930|nr:iron ABC transporter permease [Saccharospirillum mangrovi]
MPSSSLHSHWIVRLTNERLSLRVPRRAVWVLLGLLVAVAGLIALSLMLGSYSMSPAEVWSVLLGHDAESDRATVVWEFRFPRTLVAAMVGAMLAMSGAALQSVTRNALADPSLVGISQGAGLAVVALTIVWPELPAAWRPWAAFFGSLTVAALIQALSWNRNGGSSIRFILMGIGMAAFITAITSALLTYGQVERALSALAWLSGSLHAASWSEVKLLVVWLLVLLPLALALSRSMAALQMGEATAVGLGVSARWVRYALISVAVALAAIATAAVGPLGFVGLIAPHAARRLARAGVGLHLLLSAALGATIVTLADLAGRTLFAPVQIPAGLVTAIIGVPVFVVLLHRAHAKNTL